MKRLLVVIDMQNDFVSGSLGSQQAAEIVPVVADVIERERASGTEIVFTLDTHGENYSDTQEGRLLPVPHCIRGTKGWELIPALAPFSAGCKRFEKGAFGSLELADYARRGGYEEIVLCGVCTDICVVSNALLLKAYCPETAVRVLPAACAGTSPENHRAALDVMRSSQIQT